MGAPRFVDAVKQRDELQDYSDAPTLSISRCNWWLKFVAFSYHLFTGRLAQMPLVFIRLAEMNNRVGLTYPLYGCGNGTNTCG